MPFEDGSPVRGVAASEAVRAHVRKEPSERIDLVGPERCRVIRFRGGCGARAIRQSEEDLSGHACLAVTACLADDARKPLDSQELRCFDGGLKCSHGRASDSKQNPIIAENGGGVK